MGRTGDAFLSELSGVNHELERRQPETFAGLKPSYALARARELLDGQDVNIYLEPYLLHGMSAAEIARVIATSEAVVLKTIEDLEVRLATAHLQRSFGQSAQILQLINDAEFRAGKVAYTGSSDNSADR